MNDAASTIAYVGLGANLGDRHGNIRAAVERLSRVAGVQSIRLSSLREYDAVGGPPDSPPFINAVAEVRTTLDASELLAALLQIERELGRVRRERWGPRLIDLDLLLFGEQSIDTPTLTIPHPRISERPFVMEPLRELQAKDLT